MKNRGLLTEDDRRLFRDQKNVDDAEKTKRERRHNVRERIKHIAKDLEILREADEDDVLNEFYGAVSRDARVEEELNELRDRLEKLEGE
jgi:small-conductance mechanosensitive channel